MKNYIKIICLLTFFSIGCDPAQVPNFKFKIGEKVEMLDGRKAIIVSNSHEYRGNVYGVRYFDDEGEYQYANLVEFEISAIK